MSSGGLTGAAPPRRRTPSLARPLPSARCVDEYTAARTRAAAAPAAAPAPPVDPRLEAVVNRVFASALADGAYRQVVGTALEARRTDVVEAALRRALAAGALVVAPPQHTAGGGAASPAAGQGVTVDLLT